MRFEDFVSDPERSVRRICEVVGLEYDRELVPQPWHRLPFGTLPSDRKWYPLHADEWRAQVGKTEEAIIGERCAALATQLGYARSGELSPTPKTIVAA